MNWEPIVIQQVAEFAIFLSQGSGKQAADKQAADKQPTDKQPADKQRLRS